MAYLVNFTTGSVHIYRDASNGLQFWKLPPKNCRLHPGYLKDPCLGQFCFCCLWMIYQILLRHRELPVMPMILRFSRASNLTDCNALQSDLNNLVSWSESSGLIFNPSKCKYQCITRKKSPLKSIYNINKTSLESCDTEKDLVCGCQAILPWTSK